MKRPEAGEYAEFYANYISKVPGTDVLGVLEAQRLQMLHLFAGRSKRDGSFRYGAGKWTVKDASSTGRCNTFLKSTRRSLKS